MAAKDPRKLQTVYSDGVDALTFCVLSLAKDLGLKTTGYCPGTILQERCSSFGLQNSDYRSLGKAHHPAIVDECNKKNWTLACQIARTMACIDEAEMSIFYNPYDVDYINCAVGYANKRGWALLTEDFNWEGGIFRPVHFGPYKKKAVVLVDLTGDSKKQLLDLLLMFRPRSLFIYVDHTHFHREWPAFIEEVLKRITHPDLKKI